MQGIGAAGSYSMSVLILFEMLPNTKYAAYGGLAVAVVACATLLGPLLGGVINNDTTWRWVFFMVYVNDLTAYLDHTGLTGLHRLPIGAIAVASLAVALPSNFPKHADQSYALLTLRSIVAKHNVRRVDVIGASLLISASLLLVTVLNEVSVRFSWSSGVTIALLVVSALCWVAFPVWEKLVSDESFAAEPVFPWRFVHNRAWLGILL